MYKLRLKHEVNGVIITAFGCFAFYHKSNIDHPLNPSRYILCSFQYLMAVLLKQTVNNTTPIIHIPAKCLVYIF